MAGQSASDAQRRAASGCQPRVDPCARNQYSRPRRSPADSDVAWESERDHRTVVRGHYGRYFDTTFTDYVPPRTRADESFVPRRGRRPDEFVVIDAIVPGDWRNLMVPTSTTRTSTNTSSACSRRGEPLTLEAQIIHRTFRAISRITHEGSGMDAVAATGSGIDGLPGTGDDGGSDGLFAFSLRTTGSHEPRTHQQVTASGSSRRGAVHGQRWQMQASSAWSHSQRQSVIDGTPTQPSWLHRDYSDPDAQINAVGDSARLRAFCEAAGNIEHCHGSVARTSSEMLRHDSGFSSETTGLVQVLERPDRRTMSNPVAPRGSTQATCSTCEPKRRFGMGAARHPGRVCRRPQPPPTAAPSHA